ncbi:hypothetical protein LOK49_LG06G03526 [Camellia lanceoleosa]|uniref:Uncharacterized protein n=1 Tax=Camellia lanceoleosa TaxID=1840588 RepID=A0ACC0HGL5_9ERIC|nr:hypothetical protein LOK49_LG06G03526 [Camellia lanceoleosa]
MKRISSWYAHYYQHNTTQHNTTFKAEARCEGIMQQAWVHTQTGLTGLHLYCGGKFALNFVDTKERNCSYRDDLESGRFVDHVGGLAATCKGARFGVDFNMLF